MSHLSPDLAAASAERIRDIATATRRRTARRDAPPPAGQPQTLIRVWTRRPIRCAAWLSFENEWPDPDAIRMDDDRDGLVLEYRLPPAKADESTLTRTKGACPHLSAMTVEQFIPGSRRVEKLERVLDAARALLLMEALFGDDPDNLPRELEDLRQSVAALREVPR